MPLAQPPALGSHSSFALTSPEMTVLPTFLVLPCGQQGDSGHFSHTIHVHGVLRARITEWFAILSSSGPRFVKTLLGGPAWHDP